VQPLHEKRKGKCAVCNPYPHGKLKQHCTVCTGCPHGKRKYRCAECTTARAAPPSSKRVKRERESSPEPEIKLEFEIKEEPFTIQG
jgi:hypothetical protein